MRKAGPSFDLALAVALLAASGQIPAEALEGCAVCGELSLGGELRAVPGVLGMALGAARRSRRRLVVPVANRLEAELVDDLEVLGVPTLRHLVDLLHGRWTPPPERREPPRTTAPAPDLADVRGQADARRALEIAAAGGHNLLMIGPPGAGKTMLARRLPGILPPPTTDEAIEITQVQSACGVGTGSLARERPFRAPHHTISPQGLVGGGAYPRPGEITLAHRGVLFLDEVAEFSRSSLEALRQPLEDGFVVVTRGQRSLRFPAAAMLVAASNPCACAHRECRCGEEGRARYQQRLSAALRDRFDLVCRVGVPRSAELVGGGGGSAESSAVVRGRVLSARERQVARIGVTGARCNAELGPSETRLHAPLSPAAVGSLLGAVERGALSGRGHDRVLRVARTIADLARAEQVRRGHVDEALGYRIEAGALAVAA